VTKTSVFLTSLALFALLYSPAFAQTTGDAHRSLFWRLAHIPATDNARHARGAGHSHARRCTEPDAKERGLRFINSYAYATLAPHASTKAERLDGRQEIYFVQSGKGNARAGGQSVDLYQNIAILVPAGVQFNIENTGDQPMAMYVINEPTPPGFRPNTSILARDENQLPISSSSGMWAHIVKTLFVAADGLGTLSRPDGHSGSTHLRQTASGSR